jgi:hypothetical protein
MYCILVNGSNKNYIQFLKFLIENKSSDIDIIEYTTVNSINWDSLKQYDYVLILHRYACIHFSKFIEYCVNQKPTLAGLSTYWGVGFPYLTILSNKAINIIIDNIVNYKTYFENDFENLIINTLLYLLKIDNIQELLSKSDTDLKLLLEQNSILILDHECYINNIEYNKGYFHSSIFVSFDDIDDKFMSFITEYRSGKKYIKYKGIPYNLEIGKNFFVIKNYHVGILPPSNTIVIWDRSSSTWKKATKRLNKKIQKYITTKFNTTLDFGESDVTI